MAHDPHPPQPSQHASQQSQVSTAEPHPPVAADALIDPRATAAYLGVSIMTLADFRTKRVGPDYIKVGRCVRYRRSDIEAWLVSRTKQGG